MEMVLALTVGPALGLGGAWIVLRAIRHWRKKKPEPALPAAVETAAIYQCADEVRTATARMKSKAGID